LANRHQLSYDVFISYARGEYDWVDSHVYQPLTRCRKGNGEQPKIFLDKGEIGVGANWLDVIEGALQVSRKVVGVHSRLYFTRPQCKQEWQMAKALDERRTGAGQPTILFPILKDPLEPESYLPLWCHLTNYVDVHERRDWFELLKSSLDLAESSEELTLEFETRTADVRVNQTLDEVRVRLRSEPRRQLPEATVRLCASAGELSGVTETRTENGVAVFSDLVFGIPHSDVHLIAEVEGYRSGRSDRFSIAESRAIPSPDLKRRGELSIAAHGEVRFFPDSRGLTVILSDRLVLFDDRVTARGEVPLTGPVKEVVARGPLMVVTEWCGRVVLLHADGRIRAFDPPARKGRFEPVPGGAAIRGDIVEVGFWSGGIVAYELDRPPRRLGALDTGIQSLGADGDRTFVAASDGRLLVLAGGAVEAAHDLEPGNLHLRVLDGRVIAAGDRDLYYLAPGAGGATRLLRQRHPMGSLAAVFWQSAYPVLVGAQGHGVRIDRGLNYRSRFHATAGAIPVSADDGGSYCVFLNPDGTRTLMEEGKMVYTHPAGVLAVSPDASRFAVGDGKTVELLKAEDFNRLRESP